MGRRRLGDLLRAHGWHEEAFRQYETLARLTPDDALLPLLLAASAQGMGKVEEAIRWTEKAGAASAPDAASNGGRVARAFASAFLAWAREDAAKAGIVDNDWVEAFNTNGALVARAVVSQRMKEGTLFMYHAQEKIVNVPGSEMTGNRGGIHNSVTRAVLKPTHMIGGYAQLAYGFNYYGTIGTNRDEFVVIRKLAKVDWLERGLNQTVKEGASA